MENSVLDFDRIKNALTYDQFNEQVISFMDSAILDEMDETEKNRFEYTKLNIHRTNRIHKTYKPSENIKNTMLMLEDYQLWMVLTEAWCGDSAQNLPHIALISELSEKIELRILERDKNLDIMDKYLTNGTSRSIPKLVSFDKNGNELFQWGPRPSEARNLAAELKEQGLSKNEFNEKLHLWYGRNRGKNIESEINELVFNSIKNQELIER